MGLANWLTVLRILLIPVFVTLLVYKQRGPALAVFLAAALTDLLDGYVARHRGSQSRLGAVELEVDGVAQRPPVDREDAIAGRQSRRGGGRARPHRRHHDALSGRARFHPALEPRRRGRR